MDFSTEQQRGLLDYAKRVIRHELDGGAEMPTPPNDAALQLHAGCFVTLHGAMTHQLRGCIGQLRGEEPLVATVGEMAKEALHDPRFVDEPVTLEELPELEVELTVLSPLEEAKNPLDFDLLKHGIYLTYRGRGGCFLPQVARETGWDREALLARLCMEKMGLPPETWRERGAKMLRFSATILGPERF